MLDEEWIKTLEDGRKVKFVYQELLEDGAFISAQIAGNEVVYSVLLTNAGNPLSREDVESHFKDKLLKKKHVKLGNASLNSFLFHGLSSQKLRKRPIVTVCTKCE